jgi:hypothetical protein
MRQRKDAEKPGGIHFPEYRFAYHQTFLTKSVVNSLRYILFSNNYNNIITMIEQVNTYGALSVRSRTSGCRAKAVKKI